MISREILKTVRLIELRTRKIVNDLFSGEYHSVFKGRGMEFSEVREYQVGDDIRNIDWNVTARYNKPYVKVFEEERQLTVMLLVDVSGSVDFGSHGKLKREIMSEITAVLAFSAIKNNDNVGLINFSEDIDKFVPPKKGRSHVLRVIREVLASEYGRGKTSLNNALEFLSRVVRRRAVVFIISDFLDQGYFQNLQALSNKHDIILIKIYDPVEYTLPPVGLIKLRDAESGEVLYADFSDRDLRNAYYEKIRNYEKTLSLFVKKNNTDLITVNTVDSYVEPLIRFFRDRALRIR